MARRRYLDDEDYGIMTYANPVRTSSGGIPRIVAGFNPDGTVRSVRYRGDEPQDAELYGPEVTVTPSEGVFTEGLNGRTEYPSLESYQASRQGERGLETPMFDPLTMGLGVGRAAANGALRTVPRMLERGLHYMNPSAYTGVGTYSTPMGGSGTNLFGAALDNALFSGMAAAAGNEFINNPNLETSVNVGLNAIPFAAAGLPFIAKKARTAQELISALNRETHLPEADAAAQRAAQVRALEANGVSRDEAINQVYNTVSDLETPAPRNQYLQADEVAGVDDEYFRLYDEAMAEANNAEIERGINDYLDDITSFTTGEVTDRLANEAFSDYVHARRNGDSPQEAAQYARDAALSMENLVDGNTMGAQLDELGVRQDAFAAQLERSYQLKFPNDAPGTPENPVLPESNIDWTEETLANAAEPANNYVGRTRFVNRGEAEQRQILEEYGNRTFNEERELDDFLDRHSLNYDDLYEISQRNSAHDVNPQQAPEPVNPYTGMTRAEEEALAAENEEIAREATIEEAERGDYDIDEAYERSLDRRAAGSIDDEPNTSWDDYLDDILNDAIASPENMSPADRQAYEQAMRDMNESEQVQSSYNPLTDDEALNATPMLTPEENTRVAFADRDIAERQRLYDEALNLRNASAADRARFMQNNNLNGADAQELERLIINGERPRPNNVNYTNVLDINSDQKDVRALTDNVIDDYLALLEDARLNNKTNTADLRNQIIDKYGINEEDKISGKLLDAIENKVAKEAQAEREIYAVEDGKEYVVDGKKYIGSRAGLRDEEGKYYRASEAKDLLKQGGYKTTPKDYGQSIRYGGNSMSYDVSPDGTVDINHALFFNPEGEPNTLMDFADAKLKTGDMISIASTGGDLSLDSNRLLGLNLVRKINNSIPKVSSSGVVTQPTHKGYSIEPTGKMVHLNPLALYKHKGVLFKMTDKQKERALEDVKRVYKMLEKAHNEKNPNNPIHFDDKDFYFRHGIPYVPGYKARHLKYGGLVRGRDRRRTMARYGRCY